MKTEIVSFAGWEKNLRIFNDTTELLVSLDVGPRILSYCTEGTENILKLYPEQLGQAGEDAWMIRGGHRLWSAPEDEKLSYHWDNEPVTHSVADDGSIVFTSYQSEPLRLKKEITVHLAESGSRVTVGHRIVNEGSEPVTLASWALTVMDVGGVEIIPQPPLGEHPRDLLPNRNMVIWPYTNLADPRWRLGEKFFILRQDKQNGTPTKLGLSHKEGWVGYARAGALFIKHFDWQEGETYPDGGCNFETFTNAEMLEIESLGPLRTLLPGEATGHSEIWHLFRTEKTVDFANDDALAEWINPYLKRMAE